MTGANGASSVSKDEDSLTYIFQGAEATLYLSVDPEGYFFDPMKFSFETGACYIYAETITIPNTFPLTLSTEGQTLGIFCNELLFAGDKLVTFDVSGENGTDKATTPEKLDGKNSGDFYLYVENMRDAALQYLNIRACGGNGGRGVSYVTDAVGGQGGNAGNGGNVQVVFGSEFYDLAASVHKNLALPWPAQVNAAMTSVIPRMKALSDSALKVGYDADTATSWNSVLSQYGKYAAALSGLVTALGNVTAGPSSPSGGNPSANTKDLAKGLGKMITTILQSKTKFPSSIPANTDKIDALISAIKKFMEKGGRSLEKDLATLIRRFPGIIVSETSELSTALGDMISISRQLAIAIRNITSHDIVNTNRGNPGLGGDSGPGTIPASGPRGKKGADGDSSSQFLFYDGSTRDSTTSVPFVFPEQCRMLLNLADSNYFVTSPDTWADAMTYYGRLVKRLSFLDTGKELSSSNLSRALGHFVHPLGLTWSPLEELSWVYKTAQTRLNQMTLLQDMFGHEKDWVPRLSPAFYRKRAKSMIEQLAKMESAIAEFTEEDKAADFKLQQCQVGIENAKAGLQSATDRIQLISGDGGLLSTYEYQIEITNPLIRPALENIRAKLSNIEQTLRNATSLNPDDVLSAISMVAMCPEATMAAFQVGATMYKASTELADVDGVDVNRNLVIQKFEMCGGTLDSLDEAYKQSLSTGIVDLDDPAANLIISSQGNVDSLLQQFSNIIPASDSADVDKAFKAYTDLVLERNGYIASYNAALQLLLQAIHDKTHYTEENRKWSQILLDLNPDLPYIRFWLEKNRDDLRYQVMQKLNYEARANRFWGLSTRQTATASPGPLQGATDLRAIQVAIDNDFENCLEAYAGNQMNKWPASDKMSGAIYYLPDDFLINLRSDPIKTKNGLEYTTSFTIEPGSVQVLNGMANIRLSQVRLWLPGATTSGNKDPHGDQVLSINLKQTGVETIYDASGRENTFIHDPVSVEFQYICNKVKKPEDCITENVWSLQELTGQYNGEGNVPDGSTVTAPIGPYSEWVVSITSNDGLNPQLDFTNVKQAIVEFCGRSQGGQ